MYQCVHYYWLGTTKKGLPSNPDSHIKIDFTAFFHQLMLINQTLVSLLCLWGKVKIGIMMPRAEFEFYSKLRYAQNFIILCWNIVLSGKIISNQ